MAGTFADVRAVIETKVAQAYGNLNPPIDVVFDNTLETPPTQTPHVLCLISYVTTTEPTICPDGGAIERLLGNLQLSCYGPRGQGMKFLETLGQQGMVALNTMYDPNNADVRIKCGRISGPTPLLNGPEPYAVATLSCSFTAYVS